MYGLSVCGSVGRTSGTLSSTHTHTHIQPKAHFGTITCLCSYTHAYVHTSQEVTLMKWVGLSRVEINEFNCSCEITFRSLCLVALFQYTLGALKGACACLKWVKILEKIARWQWNGTQQTGNTHRRHNIIDYAYTCTFRYHMCNVRSVVGVLLLWSIVPVSIFIESTLRQPPFYFLIYLKCSLTSLENV